MAINCGRQDEPAVLISRLLLRMVHIYPGSCGRPLRMNLITICSRAFGLSIARNLITYGCFDDVKRTQSAALEQELFDLRSLSPALRNLWLLLVISVRSRLREETTEHDPLNTKVPVDSNSIANHKENFKIPKKSFKDCFAK